MDSHVGINAVEYLAASDHDVLATTRSSCDALAGMTSAQRTAINDVD